MEYDDIVNMPHHVSTRHPQMDSRMRAAQFAPFSALSGYEEMIAETARETSGRAVISEDRLEDLDHKLAYIRAHLSERLPVTVTYFKADSIKAGGSYVTFSGNVERIDDYNRLIVFSDFSSVCLDDVFDIMLTAAEQVT